MTLALASPPEKARTLAGDVLHRLRADIVTCRLKPGSALKFEHLKDAYGASFGTLREALTALAADGLVVSEEQRGFRVAPVSRADLVDLTEARVLIERQLITLSIQNGGDDWEVSTAACLHRMALAAERVSGNVVLNETWKTAHAQFHEALVAASGSPILLGMRATLFKRAERYRSLSSLVRKIKRSKIDEHRLIMEAAFSRQIQKTQGLLEDHMRATTANVLAHAAGIVR